MGLATYFSKYIPSFADIVEPLRYILRTGNSFVWSDLCQKSFDTIKELISKSPKLSIFDPELDIVVRTDASSVGLGACLNQIKNGKEVTVTCISRSLSAAERKYSVGEREALACVWACEKWHVYLWGHKFKLVTDHKALVTLLSKGSDRQSMRIARWACRLLRYNYDMVFTKGSKNVVADALSRLPIDDHEPSEYEDDKDDYEVICHVLAESMKCITLEEFTEICKKNETFAILKQYIQKGWPKYKNCDTSAKPYFQIKDELCVCNDLIMRVDRLVVPCELVTKILRLAHEAHQEMTRTKQRLRDIYWWPFMDTQVENLIKNCSVCNFNDKSVKHEYAPLKPVPYPDNPWDKISMDVIGPFERGPHDCKFAITVMDYYSKWPEICFTSNVTTIKIIGFLKQLFSREGFPQEIVTDHGSQFVSHEFENFLSERGIKHVFSSIYYPPANGAVERFNSVAKNVIQNAINTGKSWHETMVQFLGVYRATAHATTGVPPSVLLHGRHMRTKLNIMHYDLPKVKTDNVKDQVKLKQNKYKSYKDQKKNVKVTKLSVGDWVKVKKPGHVFKGEKHYSDPIQIKKKLSHHTFETIDGKKWNISKLVKCYPDVVDNNTYDFEVEGEIQVNNAPGENIADNNNNAAGNVPVNVPRVPRVRKPPVWMKDYVRY